MTGLSLRIAGSTVISRTLDNITAYRLELNASEFALLQATLNSQSALLNNLGQGFALVDLKSRNGVATFSISLFHIRQKCPSLPMSNHHSLWRQMQQLEPQVQPQQSPSRSVVTRMKIGR